MKCKLLLALAAGAMSAVFAQQAAAQPECAVGTTGYTTIQEAVDDPECRTITVPAGTFAENVLIDRSVTIRGAGPKRTTVDGSGFHDPVFLIAGTFVSVCASPNVFVTLEGMTITGGKGPESGTNRNGGGISASPFVDLVVKDCVVTGNSTYRYGGGISVANGRLTVMDSVISLNTAYVTESPEGYLGGGGGIRVQGCPADLTVVNSIIEKNVSRHQGGGILSVASQPDRGRLILKDSDIRRNEAWAANGGGGVFFDGVAVTWSDTKVKDNVPNDVQDGPPAP
jgi:hypothetical protein